MSLRSLPMAGPWITSVERKIVADCMKRGWFDYNYVERFEKEFSAHHGRSFGLMTPNCTSALHLLLLGLGVGPGDEVIVPECTWIASAAPIVYQRAVPVFCDIRESHWCLDPEDVARKITKRTKAVIAVDLFGNMPEMRELLEITRRRGIHLIEDAAEAVGSTLDGRKAGSFGIASIFSFHRTKTICTGEGGILLLDQQRLWKKCVVWRDHGRGPKTRPYFNEAVTPKYMPSNLQAALAHAQFTRIRELVARKNWMMQTYKHHLREVEECQLNDERAGVFNGAWITGVVFRKTSGIRKEEAIRQLAARGIPSRPFFYPLSSLPAFGSQGKKYRQINPVSYEVSSRGINLPCSYGLTEKQIRIICSAIKQIVYRKKGKKT